MTIRRRSFANICFFLPFYCRSTSGPVFNGSRSHLNAALLDWSVFPKRGCHVRKSEFFLRVRASQFPPSSQYCHLFGKNQGFTATLLIKNITIFRLTCSTSNGSYLWEITVQLFHISEEKSPIICYVISNNDLIRSFHTFFGKFKLKVTSENWLPFRKTVSFLSLSYQHQS